MKNVFTAPAHWVIYLFLLLLAACGSAQRAYVTNDVLQEDGRPRWVAQGSTPVKSKQDRLFFGVAATSLDGNFSTRTILADKRAKIEALKVLEAYLTVVSRDMVASGGLSESKFLGDNISQRIKSFADDNLNGVSIVGHWRDERSDMLYSIAELNLRHVSDALARSPSLDSAFRNYFLARADEVFDRIADKAKPSTVNPNVITE